MITPLLLLLITIFLPNLNLSAQCDIECDDGCAETIDSINPETCECEYVIPTCNPDCLDIEQFMVEECECVVIGSVDIFCEYPYIFNSETCNCTYCPIIPSFSANCTGPNLYVMNGTIEGLPNEVYGIISPAGDTTQVIADDTGIATYTSDTIMATGVAKFTTYSDNCSRNSYPSVIPCTCPDLPNTGLQRQGALYGVSGFPEGVDLIYNWYNAATDEQVAYLINNPYYSPSEAGEYYLIITNPNKPVCTQFLGPRIINTLDGCCELGN